MSLIHDLARMRLEALRRQLTPCEFVAPSARRREFYALSLQYIAVNSTGDLRVLGLPVRFTLDEGPLSMTIEELSEARAQVRLEPRADGSCETFDEWLARTTRVIAEASAESERRASYAVSPR